MCNSFCFFSIKETMMADQPTQLLTLQIDAPGIDANELDDLTRLLRNEVEQLDVETVKRVKSGPVPKGAMGMDWIQIGELAVELSPIIIPLLVEALSAWRERQSKGTEETSWKLKIKWGEFSFDLSTSREEAAAVGKQLTDKIEKKAKSKK
ncbi:MAG: hypothetical protein GY862_34155 [Gammaproteobacteria bacterium]|nr:hypothetical protein [Gammaproteobacteria bacterium]